MNLLQAERLLTLAYYLKTEVSPDFFDMEHWGRKWAETLPPVAEKGTGLEDLEIGQRAKRRVAHETICGTSACALGWATIVFPKVFRLSWSAYDNEMLADVEMRTPESGWKTINIRDQELLDFFGIDYCEAELLFFDGARTPKAKAEEIENLLSEHGYTYR